jgi:hypothetical protein
MQNNQYVGIFKNLIEGQVRQNTNNKVNLAFIDGLYQNINSQAKSIADVYGEPKVDKKTLYSYFDVAKKDYLSNNPIRIEPINCLTKRGFKTWLTIDKKEQIDWNYTNRYIHYLSNSGRSKDVVNEVHDASLDILSKLGNPKSLKGFYVKGLVVGEVQSGKTGNFNAVINRAIDSGYELIIVFSGIMEDLRSQTQKRIEEDVLGEGSDEKKGTVGVGEIRKFGLNSKVNQFTSITSVESDFKLGNKTSSPSLNNLNILVCKKNVSVIKNLIVWLHDYLEQDKHNIPLLIIDDEADNASLNNEGAKGKAYASKINLQIRTLLNLFHKKSYLGYTATPFANVLQDRNEVSEELWPMPYGSKKNQKIINVSQVPNIFPDDFIVLLNAPSNYVGAKKIFNTVTPIENKMGGYKLPMYDFVTDHIKSFPSRINEITGEGVEHFANKNEWDEKIGKYGTYLNFGSYKEYRSETRASAAGDKFPQLMPDSLKEAVLCFILALSLRESRKTSMLNSSSYQPHNTMLIHVSRFTSWQRETSKLVKTYLDSVIASINNDDFNSNSSIYFELNNLWNLHYADIVENIRKYLPNDYQDEFMVPITFNSLKHYIPAAIKGIEVAAINSETKYELKYSKTTPKKIIAIGGNRLSRGFTLEGLTVNYFVRKTNYSDTLLQMGRWFGYRLGYLDCCKLFATEDSIDKFHSTTKCIEELEGEFRKMELQNKTPSNFTLKVKQHPGTLKITRPTILKNAEEVKWSYQDQLVMTTSFDVHKQQIESVWNNFKLNIAPLFKSKDSLINGCLSFTTDADGIIEILRKESNLPELDCLRIIDFISKCKIQNKLTKWTVGLKCTGTSKKEVGKGMLFPVESNLPRKIQLAVRSGPRIDSSRLANEVRDKKIELLRLNFLDRGHFKATGASANIMTSAKDMSITLSPGAIDVARKEFIEEKVKEYQFEDEHLSNGDAHTKASKTNPPERIYREKMPETEGVLLIYLFDSYYSFIQEKNNPDPKFSAFVDKHDINLDIPLVGYALGIPPIKDAPGGVYMQGDYDLDMDAEEDCNESDNQVPDDCEME